MAEDRTRWYETKTFYTSLAGMVTGIGGVVAYLTAKSDSAGAAVIIAGFASVSAFIANLGSVFAKGEAKTEALTAAKHEDAKQEERITESVASSAPQVVVAFNEGETT